MEYKEKDFKYQRLYDVNFDINDYIKDDKDLLKFINAFQKNSEVIFYKDNPIGFQHESSYMGLPEFQCALFKKYRGFGISTYLLNQFQKQKFEENNPSIVLLIDKNNEISIKNAIKNGFRLDDYEEEFNPINKNSTYYVYYKNNPNYIRKGR